MGYQFLGKFTKLENFVIHSSNVLIFIRNLGGCLLEGSLPMISTTVECNAFDSRNSLCYPNGGNTCGISSDRQCVSCQSNQVILDNKCVDCPLNTNPTSYCICI